VASPAGQPSVIPFGAFELNPATGELRKGGIPLKIHPQPLRLLLLLAERPGQIVSREEIQHCRWGSNTFVDFDRGINFCVTQIRAALADDAESPRYIETLPRRGYRFIALRPHPTQQAARLPNGPVCIGKPEMSAGGATELDIHVVPPMDVAKQSADRTQPVGAPPAPDRSKGGWSARAGGIIQRRPVAAVLTAVMLVLLSGCLGWFLAFPPPAPRVLRTVQLTHFGRVEGNLIVTDGPQIYFVDAVAGHYSLSHVSATGGQPVPIATSLPNVKLFAISSDGEQLLVGSFVGSEDELPLWTVPTSGGSPDRLGDATGHGGAWSPDGQRIVYVNGSSLFMMNRDGTGTRQLAAVSGKPWQPRWSPDGRVLRFTLEDIQTNIYSIWEISAEGKKLRRLMPEWREVPIDAMDGDAAGDWTPNGIHFVFSSRRASLSGIRDIRENGGFLGRSPPKPALLTSSDAMLRNLVPAKDGKRIFFVGSKDNSELARYDAHLKEFVPYLAGTSARWIGFSRDGQWLAYVTSPDCMLWRCKLDGSERRQLTFFPLKAFYPRWSPDGKRVAVEGLNRVWLLSSGGGTPQPIEIPAGKQKAYRPTWSPDGNSIIMQAGLPSDRQNAIYRVDLNARKAVVLPGSQGLHVPEWSPDGRYVSAATADNRKLMLFDFRSNQWSELANGRVLNTSFWSPDSRYLYWEDYGAIGAPVFRVRITSGKRERVAASNQIPWAPDASHFLSGIAPDGSPVAAIQRGTADIYALDVDLP
jgi:Tol biopolymer transport system component/DNA-binding winged helix-turn-helix (wHTH) protein